MSSKKTWSHIIAALTLICCNLGAEAKTLERVDDVLARLFPKATFTQVNLILDEAQQTRVGNLLGSPLEETMVVGYEVRDEKGDIIATAYLDAHRVRTLPETVMVTVNASREIVAVNVLAFREPPEYMPKRTWYDQFADKVFDQKLQLNRGIQGVTGATLTGRATVSAVRKILCIHTVLRAP